MLYVICIYILITKPCILHFKNFWWQMDSNASLSRVDINSNNAEILNLKKSENRMHFLAACLALTCPVFVKAGCQARPLQL